VATDEGFDPAVDALDSVEAGLHGVMRGEFAPGKTRGEFRNGQLIQHHPVFFKAKASRGNHATKNTFSASRHLCLFALYLQTSKDSYSTIFGTMKSPLA